MGRCEVCEKDTCATCAGLDVPMLHFCEEHAKAHERECPEIQKGRAHIEWHEAHRKPEEQEEQNGR